MIGRWEDATTFMLLWRENYPGRLGLTISSIASDVALQEAIAEGLRLHTTQGTAMDGARRTADAAARQVRDEKTRRDNKATFKP